MTVKTITDRDFSAHIQSNGVALVDFSATWCPPCKTLLPILEELQGEIGDRAGIFKVNVEDSTETAAAFGVQAMPTVMIFQNGEPVERLVGLRPKEAYRAVLGRYIN